MRHRKKKKKKKKKVKVFQDEPDGYVMLSRVPGGREGGWGEGGGGEEEECDQKAEQHEEEQEDMYDQKRTRTGTRGRRRHQA